MAFLGFMINLSKEISTYISEAIKLGKRDSHLSIKHLAKLIGKLEAALSGVESGCFYLWSFHHVKNKTLKLGWVAAYNGGYWKLEESKKHINILEMKGVYLALKTYCEHYERYFSSL